MRPFPPPPPALMRKAEAAKLSSMSPRPSKYRRYRISDPGYRGRIPEELLLRISREGGISQETRALLQPYSRGPVQLTGRFAPKAVEPVAQQ